MLPTPLKAKLLLYGGFALLLVIIVTGHMDAFLPQRLATRVAANSEGVLMILGVCAYLDFLRPRLVGARREQVIAIGIGVALVAAGLALKEAPWPISVVTLNEAVVALGFLAVYLQWRRPVGWHAWIIPAFALLAAALAPVSGFMTDMAEAVAALILVPVVIDVVDAGLLRAELPRASRTVLAVLSLVVAIVTVHLVTPSDPRGWVENVLYYVQRTTEAWTAAIFILIYYVTRTSAGAAGTNRLSKRTVSDRISSS